MLGSKKLNPVVTELFIRGRTLKIYFVFITQSCFAVPKNIRLNSGYYSIMENLNKKTFNYSSGFDFEGFISLYKKCTAKPYSYLVIDVTLASDNSLHFGKNLSERIWKLIMTTDHKIRDEKL